MKTRLILLPLYSLPFLATVQVLATRPRIYIDDTVKTTLVNRRVSNAIEWQEFAHGCMLTDNMSSGVVNKRVSNKITASNQLTGGNSTYDAGKAVELRAGFLATSGSVFTAKIGGCEN
ncbi:3-coathanger stack domain-containing protein [Emticicia fontis]